MNVEKEGDGDFALTVSRSEFSLLSNALNEVCNGIEVWEFTTRMGSSREEAEELLEIMRRAV
jgi:hypothetical protein